MKPHRKENKDKSKGIKGNRIEESRDVMCLVIGLLNNGNVEQSISPLY
jgi:hypothetical protein